MKEPPAKAQEIIARVRNVNLNEPDWYHTILLDNPDVPLYWQGYFSCYAEELGNSLSPTTGDYRDDLLCRLQDCWD